MDMNPKLKVWAHVEYKLTYYNVKVQHIIHHSTVILSLSLYIYMYIYIYGPPHIAVQKQDDQHEHTFSNYVRIQNVGLKTCLRR